MVDAAGEALLLRLLLQLSAILLAARLTGAVFQRLGQSRSVGEMCAGVLLGPSLLGWAAPAAFQRLFAPVGPDPLFFFSHIGLIFTLFLIGMEFDYGIVPRHSRQVLGIALATMALPVAAGAALAPWVWKLAPGEKSSTAYALFIGLSLAISAIPIMGRILMETGLTRTRVGVLAITIGAVKDLFSWVLLTLAIGLARPGAEAWWVGCMMLFPVLLALAVLTLGRSLLAWAERALPERDGAVHPDLLAGLLIMLLLLAAATSTNGLLAVFGAFLAGVCLSHRRALAGKVSERLHDVTVLFFLPIFFTYTGLRADLTRLTGPLWLWTAVLTLAATAANCVPAYLWSRREGCAPRESGALAVLINTPGLMDLVILNAGLDLKVLPPELFSMLMVGATLRNFITTPALRWLALRHRNVIIPQAPGPAVREEAPLLV